MPYLMKFFWETSPVVRYWIPYTDTIPIFSIARRRFWFVENGIMLHEIVRFNLERDEIPPDPRSVCWLDVVIKMVQNNIIDILVPSKDLGDLSNSAFSYFYSKQFSFSLFGYWLTSIVLNTWTLHVEFEISTLIWMLQNHLHQWCQ